MKPNCRPSLKYKRGKYEINFASVGQIFTSRHQHYDPQRRENDKFSFIESKSICFSKDTVRVTKKTPNKQTKKHCSVVIYV